MEINFNGLIPPVDDCQELYVTRRILEEVRQPLEMDGRVTLYRDQWFPQHLDTILYACEYRGYDIVDDPELKTVVIKVPEFEITNQFRKEDND